MKLLAKINVWMLLSILISAAAIYALFSPVITTTLAESTVDKARHAILTKVKSQTKNDYLEKAYVIAVLNPLDSFPFPCLSCVKFDVRNDTGLSFDDFILVLGLKDRNGVFRDVTFVGLKDRPGFKVDTWRYVEPRFDSLAISIPYTYVLLDAWCFVRHPQNALSRTDTPYWTEMQMIRPPTLHPIRCQFVFNKESNGIIISDVP